jgi:hypothetical protein
MAFKDIFKPKNLLQMGAGVGLMFIPGGQAFGAALVLGTWARVLAPEPPKRKLTAQTVTLRGTNLPGQIIYGETRTAGMLYVPPPGTSGTNNRFLHYIIVLACHEVESIGDVWLDNERVLSSYLDESGNVTAGKFAGKLTIEKYLGTPDQTASASLVSAFPNWTEDFRGRGIAYLHIRMERDDEAFSPVPQNFFAVVRGRKVLDTRSNVTAWSDNPAMCLRDYLVEFCGVPVEESLCIAAANTCDQLVSIPGGTEKRYRCAGVISTGEEPPANAEALLSAMNGSGDPSPGAFRMFAGQYHEPVATIDESWLAGEITVQLHTPSKDVYNLVRGEYIDPERNWQPVPCWPQTLASYVTQDGRELPMERSFPMTPGEYQAQRQAYQILLQSRGQRLIEMPLNKRVMDLHVYDVVNVALPQFGINEIYRVYKWTPEGMVTLREESAGFYGLPTYVDATTVNVGATVPSDPRAPNNLSITPGQGGVLLQWVNPPSREWDQIEIYRSLTNNFETATLRATVRASSYFDVTEGGQGFFYWIRATNGRGGFSSRLPPNGGGAPGSGAPPTTGDLQATISQTSLTVAQINGAPISFGLVECFAIGGAPPYAYEWERVSGSADITATSPTSSMTSFDCTAGTSEEKSAVFRCKVTDDSTAETFSQNLNIIVYFYAPGGGGGYEEP